MTASPRQRMLAALIDIALMFAWALIIGALQTIASLLGAVIHFGPFGYNLFSLILVVFPVTIAFTVLEAGRYEATPGKLRVGLRVRSDPGGDRIKWPRALARNLLKLGLPWTLAQSAALALVTSPAPDAALGALLAAAVPLAYLASLFIADGRTIYDWITGTQVITTSVGRRFAPPSEEPADEAEALDQTGVAASSGAVADQGVTQVRSPVGSQSSVQPADGQGWGSGVELNFQQPDDTSGRRLQSS